MCRRPCRPAVRRAGKAATIFAHYRQPPPLPTTPPPKATQQNSISPPTMKFSSLALLCAAAATATTTEAATDGSLRGANRNMVHRMAKENKDKTKGAKSKKGVIQQRAGDMSIGNKLAGWTNLGGNQWIYTTGQEDALPAPPGDAAAAPSTGLTYSEVVPGEPAAGGFSSGIVNPNDPAPNSEGPTVNPLFLEQQQQLAQEWAPPPAAEQEAAAPATPNASAAPQPQRPQYQSRDHIIDWTIPFGQPEMEPAYANVGDALIFTWSGPMPHNVHIVHNKDCDFIGSSPPFGSGSPATYVLQPHDVGEIIFACSVPGHCESGQQMSVFVVDPMAPAPPPPPTAIPEVPEVPVYEPWPLEHTPLEQPLGGDQPLDEQEAIVPLPEPLVAAGGGDQPLDEQGEIVPLPLSQPLADAPVPPEGMERCQGYTNIVDEGPIQIEWVVRDGYLHMKVTRIGQGWVGIALPNGPGCVEWGCQEGSEAVLGIPGFDIEKIYLTGFDPIVAPPENQTLQNTSLRFDEAGYSYLEFSRKLADGPNETELAVPGTSTFLWAAGDTALPQYTGPYGRGIIEIDLEECV